jgi:cytochrome P450
MTTTTPSPTPKTFKQLPIVKSPDWWQTLRALFNHLDYLEESRARYGDNFGGSSTGFPDYAIFSDPKAIEQIFTANPNCFDSGVGNKSLRPLLGDFSVILLDGSSHQQQRKLLMPPFHGERMKAYGQTMYEVTQRVMESWPTDQPFEMRNSTQEITLRVILNTVFGLDQGERFEQLIKLMSEWLDTFNSPFKASFLFFPKLQKDLGAWSPWGRFVRIRNKIDELLYAEINERKNKPLSEDILSLMMAARDENGEPMSDQELRDELMGLLFAGHETTASALAWAFYWVHSQPEILDKLLDELEQCDLENDPSAVMKLPYLNAVCSETLRIYPIAIFTFVRKLKVPMDILDYHFEAGTQLIPCIYLVHHREDLYPNSKQFRPERFLERQFSPYEFIPFGGGNRRCLGYAFALFEMKLVLATVLTQIKLELTENRPIKPVRRGLTFTPENGVPMRVKV